MFREGVEALEKKGKWVRITKTYSASCVGGKSEYVRDGNKSCTSANGINDGKFSEWVQSKDLSENVLKIQQRARVAMMYLLKGLTITGFTRHNSPRQPDN